MQSSIPADLGGGAPSNTNSSSSSLSQARGVVPILPRPPPLKHRPILKLQRKGAGTDKSRERVQRAFGPGPCGIPQCKQPFCSLVSHRRWVKASSSKARSQDSTIDRDSYYEYPSSSTSSSSLSSTPLVSTIAKAGGFPDLPLDGLEVQETIIRQLFHDFFNVVAGRLHPLVIPPGPGVLSLVKQRQRDVFELATDSPLSCLNLVLAAYNYLRSKCDNATQTNQKAGGLVQNKVLQLLRQRLDSYNGQDGGKILNVIFSLILADMAIGRFGTLLLHRQAMIKIVSICGGLHNLGRNEMLYAIQLDRVFSNMTGCKPLYTTWAGVSLPIQRPALYPHHYGSFFDPSFDERSELLDGDIKNVCSEVCRAVEILEGTDWHFNSGPSEQHSPPEVFYLYYLRDRVSGKLVLLNAMHFHTHSRDQAILLTAKLVEYMTLWNCYIPAIVIGVASRIRTVIESQDIQEVWDGWEDVLVWVAFVVAAIPFPWDGTSWALDFCHSALIGHHGLDWPYMEMLDKKILASMGCFVWSVRLNDRFYQTVECLRLNTKLHDH